MRYVKSIACRLPGNEIVEGQILHRGAALLAYAPFATEGYDFLDVVSGSVTQERGRALFVVGDLALRSTWVSSSVFTVPRSVFSDRVLASPAMRLGTPPNRLLDLLDRDAPAAWRSFFDACILPSLFCVLRHSMVDTGYVVRCTVNGALLSPRGDGLAFLEDFLRRLAIAHGVILTAPSPYCVAVAS